MKPEEQAAYEQLRRHKELRLPFNESAYIGTFLAGVKWARENAGWVSIKDALPEFGDRILAYYPSSFYDVLRVTEGRMDDFGLVETIYFDEYGDRADDEFTHWLLLPSAPKQEGEK